MRKSTILWLVLSVLSGAFLFSISQQVTDGRQKLLQTQRDIRDEDESMRVLLAEWSYLNQPDRLEKLAAQYLKLAPLQARQFVDVQDIQKPIVSVLTAPPVAAALMSEVEAAPSLETEVQIQKPEVQSPEIKKEAPVPVLSKKVEKKELVNKITKNMPKKIIPKPSTKQTAKPTLQPPANAQRDLGDVLKGLGL